MVSDLALVPTADLLREITARFDYTIFAGVKDLGAATGRAGRGQPRGDHA